MLRSMLQMKMGRAANKNSSFLRAVTFGLVLAGLGATGLGKLARFQILSAGSQLNDRVYFTYLVTFEQARKAASSENPAERAIAQVRSAYPEAQASVLVDRMPQGERPMLLRYSPAARIVLENGLLRSYYLVAGAPRSGLLEVRNDLREQLFGWRATSVGFGIVVFLLTLAMGAYWNRQGARHEQARVRNIERKLIAIGHTTQQARELSAKLQAQVTTLEARLVAVPDAEQFQALEDLVARIRLLAINGGVESMRGGQATHAFQISYGEINELALELRERLRETAAAVTSLKEGSGRDSVCAVSFRRVG